MTEPKFETQAVTVHKGEKVTGRVAQIISAREVAINVGAAHGVKAGMRFAILAESPVEIIDPVSQEVLDVIDREKVRVEASEVRQKITICRTYRTRDVEEIRPSTSILMGALWAANRTYEPVETLRAKDSSLPAPLAPEESYVKINDRVVEVDE